MILAFAFIPAAFAQDTCCVEGTGSEWAKAAGAHDAGPCLLDQRCARHSNLTDKPPVRCGIVGPDGVWHGWLTYPGPGGAPYCDWGGTPHPATPEQRTAAQMAPEAIAAVEQLVSVNKAKNGGTLNVGEAEEELKRTIDALEQRCGAKGGAGESDENVGNVSPDCATAIQNLETAFARYTTGGGDIAGVPVTGAGPTTSTPASPTTSASPGVPETPGDGKLKKSSPTPFSPSRNLAPCTDEEWAAYPHRAGANCETPPLFTTNDGKGGKVGIDYHHEFNRGIVIEFQDGGGLWQREIKPFTHRDYNEYEAYDDQGIEVPPLTGETRCGGKINRLGQNPGVRGNPAQPARPIEDRNPNFRGLVN